jgi:dihydrofolate reductase
VNAEIVLVVARAANGVIGNKGGLPWHIPEDLKRFKALTLGKPIIMGRKTWDSLPRKPLPGRTNIVVTRDGAFRGEGVKIAPGFDEAVEAARAENPTEIAVIGGAALFAAALPLSTRIELTEVEGDFEGDVFLPEIDRRLWHEVKREGPHTQGALRYSFVTLKRI